MLTFIENYVSFVRSFTQNRNVKRSKIFENSLWATRDSCKWDRPNKKTCKLARLHDNCAFSYTRQTACIHTYIVDTLESREILRQFKWIFSLSSIDERTSHHITATTEFTPKYNRKTTNIYTVMVKSIGTTAKFECWWPYISR